MLDNEETELIKKLSKPALSFQAIENYFIEKGINPFAPWMEEDYRRVELILDRLRSKADGR